MTEFNYSSRWPTTPTSQGLSTPGFPHPQDGRLEDGERGRGWDDSVCGGGGLKASGYIGFTV